MRIEEFVLTMLSALDGTAIEGYITLELLVDEQARVCDGGKNKINFSVLIVPKLAFNKVGDK
jgi:hypothetical protein